jgi:hypothetical protein
MSVAFVVGDALGYALVRPGRVVVGLVSGQDGAQVLWVPKMHATWAYAPRSHMGQCRRVAVGDGLHAGGRAMISGLWA